MVLNMDTELQRLIYVSVEKMSSDSAGSGARKGRGLDLRKALLVAHVLQDMRSAYMTDDYKVLVNTVCPNVSSENEMEKIKRKFSRKEYDEEGISTRKRKFVSDDWTTGAVERPPRSEGDDASFMTSQYRCPSMSQSCLLTCSDATMSKISQMTHPIPVSVNTSYVLSHQTSEKEGSEEIEIDGDTPAVSEQVEVTSSESDSEPTETEIVQCEELLNTGDDIMEFSENRNITVKESTLTKSQEITTKPSISCPLPRKKRPLPKEFLEPTIEDISSDQKAKRTKTDAIVTSSSSDVIITSSHCMNTTTATTLTQSTALSRSSSSQSESTRNSNCSTLTSSVCTMSLVSSSTRNTIADSNSENKPKVVVEKMNKQSSISGLWPWALPVTCTQPRLSSWVADGVYRAQLVDISNSIHTVGMQGLVAY